jgi:hypothetical protein
MIKDIDKLQAIADDTLNSPFVRDTARMVITAIKYEEMGDMEKANYIYSSLNLDPLK